MENETVISFVEDLVEVSCPYSESNAALEKLKNIISSFPFPIYYSAVGGSKLSLVISQQHLNHLSLDETLEIKPVSAVLLLGSSKPYADLPYISAIKGRESTLFLCNPSETLNLIMKLHNISEN